MTTEQNKSTVTVTSDREGNLYTRVFESILDSSINVQSVPPSARWLWVTMLLIADHDRTGVVDIPNERLAAKAGLTLDQTLEGLAILSAPDIESRSEDEEGRRIVPIRDGSTRGWRLVNWERYRLIAKEEQMREETRQRVAKHRERRNGALPSVTDALPVTETNASEAASLSASTEERLFSESTKERDRLFDGLWSTYQRKRGKEDAKKSFARQIRTFADYAALRSAIANYAEEIRTLETGEEHVMYGSTFFNGKWRDFVTGVWERPRASRKPGQPTGFQSTLTLGKTPLE